MNAHPETRACSENAVPRRINLPVAGGVNALALFGGPPPAEVKKRALHHGDALAALRQALDRSTFRKEALPEVGITGPGEPLADMDSLCLTLEALRGSWPGLRITLASNGINGAAMAPILARLGVNHVVLRLDTVDPETVPLLYAWVRPGKTTLRRSEAGTVLVAEQAAALSAFVEQGLGVTVRILVVPGVNDAGVAAVAAKAASLGATGLLLVPYVPGAESEAPRQELSPEAWEVLRAGVLRHLPLVDAAAEAELDPALGLVPPCQDLPLVQGLAGLPKPSGVRPNVAVATSDGFTVDLHLGQAKQFLIYGAQHGPVSLMEARQAPSAGQGDARWLALADRLRDCAYILTASAGQNPERVLGEQGLRVLRVEGNIESLVDTLYGGGKRGKNRK